MQRETKRRVDSIEQFRTAGRDDLVEREEASLSVLEKYMPVELTEDELNQLVRDAIAEAGASDVGLGKGHADRDSAGCGSCRWQASQLCRARGSERQLAMSQSNFQDVMVQVSNASGYEFGDFESLVVDIPAAVFELEGEHRSWDISIVFTSDKHLRQLHSDHLEDDSLTDVMTFHYEPDEFSEFTHIGEIVISVDRAVAQARDEAWSLDRELSFLVVHGLLHLSGWKDDTDDRRSQMLERQSDSRPHRRGLNPMISVLGTQRSVNDISSSHHRPPLTLGKRRAHGKLL